MHYIADFFSTNPWFNVVTFFLSIIGILASYLFYRRSIKDKKPKYAIRSVNLVRDKLRKLKSLDIRYQNEQIENLTISKVAFWNAGRETIDSKDIPNSSPVQIGINNEFRILDHEILYTKKESNLVRVTASDDAKSLTIDFEYLDQGEGAVVQIIHTGKSSLDLSLSGTIKGGKSFERLTGGIVPFAVFIAQNSIMRTFSSKRGLALSFFLIPLLICILFFFLIDDTGPAVLITMGIVCISYWKLAYESIRRIIPKGFDVFENEFLE